VTGQAIPNCLIVSHKYFTEHRLKNFLSSKRDDLESTVHAGYPRAYPGPAETPPTLRAAVRMVASLGGFSAASAMANREPSRYGWGCNASMI
jgi:hypothetical protein